MQGSGLGGCGSSIDEAVIELLAVDFLCVMDVLFLVMYVFFLAQCSFLSCLVKKHIFLLFVRQCMYLFVCLSARPSVRLSALPSIRVFVCLFVDGFSCVFEGKNDTERGRLIEQTREKNK